MGLIRGYRYCFISLCPRCPIGRWPLWLFSFPIFYTYTYGTSGINLLLDFLFESSIGFIWKIRFCKLSVVFFRSGIVSLRGGDFVGEISEVYSAAVTDDCSPPQALVGGEPHALIAGAGISLLRVPGVLCYGCHAKVGPAVVEAEAVYMVDDETIALIAMVVLSSTF